MLHNVPTKDKTASIERITKRLTDLSYNKSHDRHIHYKECIDIGLNIEMLESPK